MGFWDKLFRRKKQLIGYEKHENGLEKTISIDENVLEILELKVFVESLLSDTKYIAKSD